MVFSSLLFVFLFLALNLVSQAALRGVRQKNIAMLLFSLVFFSWAGPRYVVLRLLFFHFPLSYIQRSDWYRAL